MSKHVPTKPQSLALTVKNLRKDEPGTKPSSTRILDLTDDEDGQGLQIIGGVRRQPKKPKEGEPMTKPSASKSGARIVDMTERDAGMGFGFIGGVRPPSKKPQGKV